MLNRTVLPGIVVMVIGIALSLGGCGKKTEPTAVKDSKADPAASAQGAASMEADLARTLKEQAEFYVFKTAADLPADLAWQDGRDLPVFADPAAKKGGTYQFYPDRLSPHPAYGRSRRKWWFPGVPARPHRTQSGEVASQSAGVGDASSRGPLGALVRHQNRLLPPRSPGPLVGRSPGDDRRRRVHVLLLPQHASARSLVQRLLHGELSSPRHFRRPHLRLCPPGEQTGPGLALRRHVPLPSPRFPRLRQRLAGALPVAQPAPSGSLRTPGKRHREGSVHHVQPGEGLVGRGTAFHARPLQSGSLPVRGHSRPGQGHRIVCARRPRSHPARHAEVLVRDAARDPSGGRCRTCPALQVLQSCSPPRLGYLDQLRQTPARHPRRAARAPSRHGLRIGLHAVFPGRCGTPADAVRRI
jgi:hypothetical protein